MTTAQAARLAVILTELRDHTATIAEANETVDAADLGEAYEMALLSLVGGAHEAARENLLDTAAAALLLIEQLDAESHQSATITPFADKATDCGLSLNDVRP